MDWNWKYEVTSKEHEKRMMIESETPMKFVKSRNRSRSSGMLRPAPT